MITAIVDTNVLVQAVISRPQSASVRALKAYRNQQYKLVFSAETLEEVHTVLSVPIIRARHGWPDDQIAQHLTFLLANSLFFRVSSTLPHTITRDVTDTKFLALAMESRADYLVTNDRRHLLPLKKFRRTKIVTPTGFLHRLP